MDVIKFILAYGVGPVLGGMYYDQPLGWLGIALTVSIFAYEFGRTK